MGGGEQGGSWASGLAGLLLAGALGAAFSKAYRLVVSDLFYAFLTEEYSYLAVVFTVLVASSTALARAGVLDRPRLSRVLVALVYFASSGFLWHLSSLLVEQVFVLRTASLVVFVWGLAALLYTAEGFRSASYFILALLFLIPVPRDALEQLAVHLSRNVGYAVSLITGSRLVVEGARTFLDYGGGVFELAYGCSGVIGLSSIVALTPLLLYIVRNAGSKRRKVKAVALGVVAGCIIALLGNVLRVAAVVWVARSRGIGTALRFFHTVPSLLYAAVATVAAIIVAYRAAEPHHAPRSPSSPAPPIRPRVSTLITYAALVTVALLLLPMIAPYTLPEKAEVRVYSYDYVVNHMEDIAFSSGVKLLYSEPVPALERVLGCSIVKRIRVLYNGSVYDGYLEFAETPARFHGWWVCLTYQGFRVLSVWRGELNGTTVVYISYRDRAGNDHLMAYTVYTIPLYFGGVVSEGYIRISLFKPVNIAYLGKATGSPSERLNKTAERLGRALTQGVSRELRTLSGGGGLRAPGRLLYIRIYHAILAAAIAYYALSYTYTALHNLYSRIAARRRM